MIMKRTVSIIMSQIVLLLAINAYAINYQITEYTYNSSQINVPDQLYNDVSGLGGSATAVYGQNNSGQYVGAITFYSSRHMTDFETAFIWDSINGANLIAGMSHAVDINEYGQVAGSYVVPWFEFHSALIWDSTNGIQDLGSLGYKWNYANGINDSGWVVGSSADLNTEMHAFIWNNNDGMQDLNSYIPDNSGWTLIDAWSISNNGQIIGSGTLNGQTSTFIMTPTVVPEPISSILFITGGTLLAGRRYLKRKKRGNYFIAKVSPESANRYLRQRADYALPLDN